MISSNQTINLRQATTTVMTPTTTTTASNNNHHSRHHSFNSLAMAQIVNKNANNDLNFHANSFGHSKTMSLHNDSLKIDDNPQQQQHQCNGHSNIFRHVHHYHHCQLDNNLSSNNNMIFHSKHRSRWTLIKPEPLMAIAICNYSIDQSIKRFSTAGDSSSSSSNSKRRHHLPLCLGDVVVIVEYYGTSWFRGYLEHEPQKLGIFPASHVQVFDDYRTFRFSSNNKHNSNDSLIFYYYSLLDPLYLQVIRTLREWHHHLVVHYRTNVTMEKFLIVRNLIYELLELCSTLGKDLAPSLWRKRSSQLLKINSDPKDPFSQLYLGEEEIGTQSIDSGINCGTDEQTTPMIISKSEQQQQQERSSVFDSSLEDLYERILIKLNQGNQHLNLDIMPSFTHGTFQNVQPQKDLLMSCKTLFNNNDDNLLISKQKQKESSIKKRNKFKPYFINGNSKYLTHILDYYNHINRGFNQKFKSNITANTSSTSSNHQHRHSFSFVSPLLSSTTTSTPLISSNSSASNPAMMRKFRRHLLLMIREVNFSNLSSNLVSDSDQLQIDFYILRCNNDNTLTTSSSLNSSDCCPYEVLTEKYCYRVNLHLQQQQQSFNYNNNSSNNSTSNNKNINKALFLDILSKRSPHGNGLSHHTGGHHHFQSSTSSSSHQASHYDASNYYLIVQVWRNGKMLLNESRTKNMLSATSSLTTGSSVFHTISSSSISSVAAAATSNSLSSLTSFVSNSSLFNSNNTEKSNSNSSDTPDSSSIDSSEFGSPYFKRSVGFSVIPLLDLVSRDKEIRPSQELFQNENFLSKILLADEQTLIPLSVKLYEGDLTVSILETMLKHRQALVSNSLSNHHNITSQSSSSISKLSPLPANNYQLIVCAKFISELMIQNHHQQYQHNYCSQPLFNNNNGNNKRLSGNGFLTISGSQNSFLPLATMIEYQNVHLLPPPLSLADHLLMNNQQKLVNNNNNNSSAFETNNFVLVQKRCFGDLITAGYFRNDFYLTLDSAEFEKGGKTIPKNIEVSVCLITENGIQERAITSGVNIDPVTIYRSHIQYHQNCPKWFEHIKVDVPLEQFESAHLRFIFCHCSSKERERKFLGFSFLPLADQNGACLPDGEHELYIYKCDSEKKLDDVGFYLNGSVPWGQRNESIISSSTSNSSSNRISQSSSNSSTSSLVTSSLLASRSSKEVFHIKTTLISSKLTQNSDILSLLKWSCTPLEQVYESLQRFSRVPGEEMVKFLEDILDALFALFTNTTNSSSNDNQVLESDSKSSSSATTMTTTQLIFRVIVDFFKTLNDPKFVSYRSALEKYIEKQFSAPLVYSGLIGCVRNYIELVIVSVQQNETGSISGVTKRELEFILRCLSVFDWIIKIIVQSRILYTRAAIGGSLILDSGDNKTIKIQTDEQFKEELMSLFYSINRLLLVECKSSDDYLIVAIKESALNSLPNSFIYLSQILRPLEIAKLVQSLVILNHNSKISIYSECFSPVSPSSSITPTNSTPTGGSACSIKKAIINAKLTLLQQTIQFKYVWSDEESRLELLDTFIRLFNICITESKNSLYILRDIIIYLIDQAPFDCCKIRRKRSVNHHPREREIEMLSFGVIDALVEHIIEQTGVVPTSFDLPNLSFSTTFKLNNLNANVHSEDGDYLGTMIICLMVLLDFMALKHYEKLLEKRTASQCKEIILNIFAVFLNALYYFPDNWLEIKMAINRIMLHTLTMLRTIMSQKFLGPDRFDETIWRMYFKLAIAFLTQQRLQLESLNFSKRQFILDVYGCDMRILMGFELVACWDLIGPFKISFIPNLVSSFVDVTLVPELELRRATIPIFYDMLMVDYISNSNFKQVEAALIDKLDVVAHKIECDSQFKELFTQILTEKIESNKPVWNQEGLKLVQSISRLLALLIDYRQELKRKLNGGGSNSAVGVFSSTTKTTSSSVTASAYEIEDRLLICTYTLLRFFRDEIDSTNRKTIMLRYLEKLAQIHTLLGNYAEAAFTLKLQADQLQWSSNESQRKESLCVTMLNYFDKGHCWEEGIKVCKDLQNVYEKSYKYSKLSTILKRNAELLEKILTQHRPDHEYFRVSFYGLNFPSFLQNTTFIFRGLEFEKISSFTDRIQQEFPNAQLLTKPIRVPTDENITESHCQYIQIFNVKPIPEPPVSPDKSLIFGPPDNVLDYYNTNRVRQFTQDLPMQRGIVDPNNEFKSLWIERTIYTTEQPLPGMLRMFKVVSTLVTYLSPIENACETIENKNNDLMKSIATTNRPESISPLTMRLQGILEAAVNGGIAKYIDAFLGSEYLTANPDQVANISRLKDRIANQIQIVENGLTLHGTLAPEPVRPLHNRLLERFNKLRNLVHQANIEISQALLWAPSNSSSFSHGRPSILSQPLPPLPFQRQDAISEPDTSSLSSTSSLQMANILANEPRSTRTPPLSQPPPPPSSLFFSTQSPGSKSLKSKPLPPLPPLDHNNLPQRSISPLAIKRHHSNVEHRFRPLKPGEDTIYSVPQYTDLDLNNLLPDNESSVDDSMDYCDVQVEPPTNATTNNNNNDGDEPDGLTLASRTNRSYSIPCPVMNGKSLTNHSDQLNDKSGVAPPPPPLPPRSSTLDRSNSLNSGNILRPPNYHPPPPPPGPPLTMVAPPPALPQRPIKKCAPPPNGLVSKSSSSSSSGETTPPTSSAHFAALDGLEFENLVLSSPTPVSTHANTTGRPAPIIGIEINNNLDTIPLATATTTTNDTLYSFVPAEHRAKSSSLPRSLQQQQQSANNPKSLTNSFDEFIINENIQNNNNNNSNNNGNLTKSSATIIES